MSNLKVVKELNFWVLAIAAALITLYFPLTWRSDNTELLSTSFLFWLAVSSLLWKRRDILNLESGFFLAFLVHP